MSKYVCSFHAFIDADSEQEAKDAMSNRIACEHKETDIECFKIELDSNTNAIATFQDLVDIGLKPQGAGMKTKRTITIKECPWLDKDIPAGTEVYDYLGCTYGCISPSGIAVSFQKNADPFFEIPRDAVKE